MSPAAILAILIPVLVVLAVIVFVTSARRSDARRGVGTLARETVRRDRSVPPAVREQAAVATGREVERAAATRSTALETAPPVAPAPYVPPEPEQIAMTRRQFFNRSSVTLMGVGIGAFGASCVAFLWPQLSGGFGSRINAGRLDEVLLNIRNNNNFFYLAEGRTWLTEYPAEALPKARGVYPPSVLAGMEAGIVALYQKCPHLGCRVPECASSQWFECPCHGSQYNRVGEKKAGPAPRGMDRWPVSISGGNVIVDTATPIQGPPIGTNTTGQEAEGPHCITGGGGH